MQARIKLARRRVSESVLNTMVSPLCLKFGPFMREQREAMKKRKKRVQRVVEKERERERDEVL